MDSTIKIFDLINGKLIYTILGHEGPICCVNFSNCGHYFISGGTDAILMIWKSNIVDNIFNKSKKRTLYNSLKENEEIKSNVNYISNNNFDEGNFSNKALASSSNRFNIDYNNNESNNNKFDISNNTHFGNDNLKSTFEKLLNKIEIVGNTMNDMNKRLEKLENQVGDLYKEKKIIGKNKIKEIKNENINKNDFIDNINNYNIENNKIDENIFDEEEEKKKEELENLENAENLKDTMKYYQEKFNVKNVFEQNKDNGN